MNPDPAGQPGPSPVESEDDEAQLERLLSELPEPKSLRRRVWVAMRITHVVFRFLALVYFGVRIVVRGAEHVPATGAAIISPNHPTVADPALAAYGVSRVVRRPRRNVAALAKNELFRGLLGVILRWFGQIPVARGTTLASQASLYGIRVLRGGGIVMVFAEGGCTKPGERLSTYKRGPAFMAWATGAPLIPTAIIGAETFMPLGKKGFCRGATVLVMYGEPIFVDRSAGTSPSDCRRIFTGRLYAAQLALMAEAEAVYATL